MVLLDVKNLSIVDTRTKDVIVANVSFQLERNRCLGIVGESGSGKSMTVNGIVGLIDPWLHVSGEANFLGENLLKKNDYAMRSIRGKHISVVMQDAMSAFDPLSPVGKQMIETFRESLNVTKKQAKQLSIQELERVGLKEAVQVMKKYPHQLSGGMLQRCMIAIAIAVKPDVIIADEPTTALDTVTQSEVIQIFDQLRKELGIAVIFISHDLAIIQKLASDVLVMKEGKQVEYGSIEDVFRHPKHAYTKYLVHTRTQLTRSFEQAIQKKEC